MSKWQLEKPVGTCAEGLPIQDLSSLQHEQVGQLVKPSIDREISSISSVLGGPGFSRVNKLEKESLYSNGCYVKSILQLHAGLLEPKL